MALIALGVSGGIGAYKAVEVARGLQRQGHEVVTLMTDSATKFVGPLTFEAITQRRVVTDQYAPGANADIEHVSLAADIDLLLVAPATANIIAKFAHGLADDVLTSLHLATTAPVLMAPAMNTNMLAHPSVRANLETLAGRNVRFVDPGEGYLACGWVGKGRLAEPDEIVVAVDQVLSPQGDLAGRCLLVTAGPTYEDLDPVRYLGNRSTGRMGFAVAAEAMARGARVILVSGPTEIVPPAGAEVTRVRSAEEMHAAVMGCVAEADGVVMAAAVADYTPAEGGAPDKIQKTAGDLSVTLRRTPDIVGELGRRRGGARRPLLVGFAAETTDVVARARAKLEAKQMDLIVANDVSRPDAGFAVDTNEATIIAAGATGGAHTVEAFPLGPKRALAGVILDHVERLLTDRGDVVPGCDPTATRSTP